jgi:receptor protein-tyrosine kinase
MNADFSHDKAPGDAPDDGSGTYERELSSVLIAHYKLTDEQLDQVKVASRASHLGFGEAAVHLGVVTQRELDEAIAWVRRSARDGEASIVETAMRRRTKSREVTAPPQQKLSPIAEVILAHDPNNPRSERIRALRTALLLLDDTPSQAHAVALLSPGAGEGRSLLAAELAVAFSQLRRRTLLVDADLRHPRQHILFGAENAWGLAQALALGGAPQVLSVKDLSHLSVLTAGATVQNPLELLSDGRFGRLLNDWRYDYDFIVIDTPPVSSYADGLAIATTAGRALVLSRAAMTPRSDMKDMMRRLASAQTRVLGAVLSRF